MLPPFLPSPSLPLLLQGQVLPPLPYPILSLRPLLFAGFGTESELTNVGAAVMLLNRQKKSSVQRYGVFP